MAMSSLSVAPGRLPERCDAILAYLRDCNPRASMREIGLAVGVASTSLINDYLDVLERRGLITRDRRVARGIRLVGHCECGGRCPCHGAGA